MIEFRDSLPEDRPTIARIWSTVLNESITAETLASWQAISNGGRLRRVAILDGALVAFAAVASLEGKCWFRVVVEPAARGLGIGSRLLDDAQRFARATGASRMSAYTQDAAAVHLGEKRGFRVEAEMVLWELDLDSVECEPSSIATHTLAEYRDLERVHDALPAMEYGEVEDRAEFLARIRGDERLASMQVVALEGDTVVGVAFLALTPGTGVASHAGTGVLESHRRRGIATAMKLRTIVEARRCGLTRLESGNDSNNLAALALNRSLGYREKGVLLTLTADL